MMRFIPKPADPLKLDVDTLIRFCYEEDLGKLPLDFKNLSLLLKDSIAREQFGAREGESLSLSTKGLIGAYKLLIVGAGKKEELTQEKLYGQVAESLKKATEGKPVKIAIVVPTFWLSKFETQFVAQAIVEAISLASYRFLTYKNEEERKKRQIKEVILSLPAGKLEAAEEGIKKGLLTSQATVFARDLINEPPFVTTPSHLADVALSLSKASKGTIKTTVLEKEDVLKLGMNCFLGVAKGSIEPPKFIILRYTPPRPHKKIAIVGKGITFDTGGLSLKSAEHMETMKLDMSGAAAVLAVFQALPKLTASVEVVGIIAACENMPSGRALKPGDILRALNGKTVEVLNTDAEGRLTLADSLSYVEKKEKPDEIIDLATLTGACMVALGEEIAGLWGNDEKLLAGIEKAALLTGEKIWRMPLEKQYKKLIKSTIADLKNIQTGRYGGAVTAALFLAEFAGKNPWVHLDIAGPAFAEKDSLLVPRGAAGFGVRLLLHYLTNL